MLFRFAATPKSIRVAKSAVLEFANASITRTVGYINPASEIIFLLPKRVTRYPDNAIAHICPNGNASKIAPKSASLRLSLVLTSAILLAHDAKTTP